LEPPIKDPLQSSCKGHTKVQRYKAPFDKVNNSRINPEKRIKNQGLSQYVEGKYTTTSTAKVLL